MTRFFVMFALFLTFVVVQGLVRTPRSARLRFSWNFLRFAFAAPVAFYGFFLGSPIPRRYPLRF